MKPEEKRTTANLVRELNQRGYPAVYENTGGGCMAGYLEIIEGGLSIYFNDDVPAEIYDKWVATGTQWDVVAELWKNYEGGFDVNTADGGNLFSATIGGSHNLGAIHTADDMAKEYVRILKGLGYGRQVPTLPSVMDEALERFLSAGYSLLNCQWPDWVNAETGRYPKYLPEFEEFLIDFHTRMRGEFG